MSLTDLKGSGEVASRSGHQNGEFQADASGLLRVDFNRLFSLAMDYDHYVQMGMPSTVDCHVVSRDPEHERIVVWAWMHTRGQTSKHYLEAQVVHNLPVSGSIGLEWQLVHRQVGWPYEEDSDFSQLDGSWYQEPQADGSIYVRYFVSARVDSLLPDFIIGWVAGGAMEDGAREVVQILARQAALGH